MKDDVKHDGIKVKKSQKDHHMKPIIDGEKFRKFARGNVEIDTRVKNSALKRKLEHTKSRIAEAVVSTASTEVLLPSVAGGIELEDNRMKVFKLKQQEIVQNVDLNTAKNAFDFQLTNFGPYYVNFSRNGRYDLQLSLHLCTTICLRIFLTAIRSNFYKGICSSVDAKDT